VASGGERASDLVLLLPQSMLLVRELGGKRNFVEAAEKPVRRDPMFL